MDDCWYYVSILLPLREWFTFRCICRNFYVRTKKDEYGRKISYLQSCAINVWTLFYFQFDCEKDAWLHFITLLYHILYKRDKLRIRISGVSCSGRSSLLRGITRGLELNTHVSVLCATENTNDHILAPSQGIHTREICFTFAKTLKVLVSDYDKTYEEAFRAIKKLNFMTDIISKNIVIK